MHNTNTIIGYLLIVLGFFGLLGVGIVLFPASLAWVNGLLIFGGAWLSFRSARHG